MRRRFAATVRPPWPAPRTTTSGSDSAYATEARALVEPVAAARAGAVARSAGAVRADRPLVSPQVVELGHDRPGDPGAVLTDQADGATTVAERGLEGDEPLDDLVVIALEPRAELGVGAQVADRAGRQVGAQHLGDGLGAAVGAEVPGERQQVTPPAVGGEEGRDARGVRGAQGRPQVVEPRLERGGGRAGGGGCVGCLRRH